MYHLSDNQKETPLRHFATDVRWERGFFVCDAKRSDVAVYSA